MSQVIMIAPARYIIKINLEATQNQKAELIQFSTRALQRQDKLSMWRKVLTTREDTHNLGHQLDITMATLRGSGNVNMQARWQVPLELKTKEIARGTTQPKLALWINIISRNHPHSMSRKREQTLSPEAIKETTRPKCNSKSTKWEDKSFWIKVLIFSITWPKAMVTRPNRSNKTTVCIS